MAIHPYTQPDLSASSIAGAVNYKEKAASLAADLDMANHALAHELLTPIREMGLLLRRLREEPWVADIPELADIKDKWQYEWEKLQRHHAALLEFVRLCVSELRFKSVDMNELLAIVKEELAEKIQATQARITADPLPTVTGRKTQLALLLRCLLDNALTFCTQRPEIHIGAQSTNNAWHFTIRDNGIGIGEEFLETIFILFQRVPDSNIVSNGTGAGLTFARKIVEAHGGTLDVASEPERGSTFYFTLPVAVVAS